MLTARHIIFTVWFLLLGYLLTKNVPHFPHQTSLTLSWALALTILFNIRIPPLTKLMLIEQGAYKKKLIIISLFVISALTVTKVGLPEQHMQSVVSEKPSLFLILLAAYGLYFKVHLQRMLLTSIALISLAGLFYIEQYILEAELLAITGFLVYAFAIIQSAFEKKNI